MAVDGDAVDFVNAECARRKRGHRNRRSDQRIHLCEYFQERHAQGVATIAGLDIFDAAEGGTFRHDLAVVAVGRRQRIGSAGCDGRRLLGIGDRLQYPLEHVGFELNAIGNDACAKRTERFDRRLKRLANVRRDRRIAEVGAASDPDPVELRWCRVKAPRRHRQAGGIAQVMGRNRFQKQRCIGNRARDRTSVG